MTSAEAVNRARATPPPCSTGPNAYPVPIANKSQPERLAGVLQAGGQRQIILTCDRRDRPPWTAELRIDNKLIGLRAARTLAEAISRVQSLAPRKLPERAAPPLRS